MFYVRGTQAVSLDNVREVNRTESKHSASGIRWGVTVRYTDDKEVHISSLKQDESVTVFKEIMEKLNKGVDR